MTVKIKTAEEIKEIIKDFHIPVKYLTENNGVTPPTVTKFLKQGDSKISTARKLSARVDTILKERDEKLKKYRG